MVGRYLASNSCMNVSWSATLKLPIGFSLKKKIKKKTFSYVKLVFSFRFNGCHTILPMRAQCLALGGVPYSKVCALQRFLNLYMIVYESL